MDEKELAKDAIKQLIYMGYSVEKKGVSITDLRGHLPQVMHHSRKYQVWSPNFSKIYEHLDDAVDKFLELRKK